MYTRQWKATWSDQDGTRHEYIFATSDNRMIAGIDFRLQMLEQGITVPESFELEEGRRIVRVVPSLRELEGRS